jgi:hypothetical protein
MPFLLMENLKIFSGWSRLLPMRCVWHMSVDEPCSEQGYVAHRGREESG